MASSVSFTARRLRDYTRLSVYFPVWYISS